MHLDVADPALANPLRQRAVLRLAVRQAGVSGASPGSVTFARNGGRWDASVDFSGAGYPGFRIEADGSGVVHTATSASGPAFSTPAWPAAQQVRGRDDRLEVRVRFAEPVTVTLPAGSTIEAVALTLVLTAPGGRPVFPSGSSVQLLAQGLLTTGLSVPDEVWPPVPGSRLVPVPAWATVLLGGGIVGLGSRALAQNRERIERDR